MNLEIWENKKGEVHRVNTLQLVCTIQENIKKRLQESAEKYKQRVEMKRREVNFQVGDLVMAYLRKERTL